MAHFTAERYEDAVDWAQRSVQRRPDWPLGYRCLAASYAYLGRDGEARAALQEVLRLQPEFSSAQLRLVYASADPAFVQRYIDGLR